MKKLLVVLMIVALVMVFASSAFAAGHGHPKGPDSMPEQSLRGLHRAVFEVPEFPQHIVVGLMVRTGVPCH